MNDKNYDFLDNLKVFLAILVVVHHAGQPYGANGWWYFEGKEVIPTLGTFFAINASFFMSLFFLISAYFMTASVDKKGPLLYIKERFIRLGIPLLLGFLIIIPILMYSYYLNFRGYDYTSYLSYFFNIFLGFGNKWPIMARYAIWALMVYSTLIFI